MTLAEAIDVALAAYDEDEAEREAIIDKLAPVLLGSPRALALAIRRIWQMRDAPGRNEIREALAEYQADRERIDAEIAADEGS